MDTTQIDNRNYVKVHNWLIRTYGKASKCESVSCDNKSKHLEYAQIHGTECIKDRTNFMMLCRKCHVAYDNLSKKCWETRRQVVDN